MTKPTHGMGNITMGLSWIDRIDSATSAAEILDVVRVYTAGITPAEFALLPVRCRPRKLVDAADLSEYALDLVRETCRADEPSPLVLKMAAIVSHAATRASEILGVANDSAGEERLV